MSSTLKGISVSGACLGIALVMCFAAPVRAGDRLDDFKDGARGSGCSLIPYESLGRNCRDNYKEQREWCEGDKKVGCSSLDKGKEEDRALAKERKDNAVECIKRRQLVKRVYDDALDKLNYDESHDPEPEIRSLATEIIRKIKDGQEGHKTALEETEKRRDKCQEVEDNR